MRQPLLYAALAALTAGIASAQQPDAPALARGGFAEVHGWVMRAAEMVPAERYTYRPVATVRSFAQLIGHLADSYDYYCARAAGRNLQWTEGDSTVTDKNALIARLRRAGEACTAVYAGTAALPPLLANVTHTHLHYGNMVTYMRMLGLVPPSS